MAFHADAACILKVNIHCDSCKMKTMEILSSIVGVYSVTIDGEEGLAKIYGEVDPNMLLRAIATSGKHAELVGVNIKHPQIKENASYNRRHGYNYDSLDGNGYTRARALSADSNLYGNDHCYYPMRRAYVPDYSYDYTNSGTLPEARYVPSYPPREYEPYEDERINCCTIM